MDEKILVTRSSMPSFEEYTAEIRDLWESRWLTNMGAKHNQFRAELSAYLGVENTDLFTNGHMAIELSLQAMGLKGEVITTPFTFISTTHAIVRNGLQPVFCDIDPKDYTMDVSQIEELITPKTCAILPVHVYGNVCQVEEIERIASQYGLKVLYDAAHAFGVRYKGRGVASFGDASCFSFHATKVFHSVEGGAVCFKDRDFGQAVYSLKDFGIQSEAEIDGVGANAKMNEFCAAMGLCNLRHMEEVLAQRKRVVQEYRRLLADIDGLQLNVIQKDVEPNYAYFPIVVDEEKFGADRDEICEKLRQNNIFARKYFYPLTNAVSCYKDRFDAGLTPRAAYVSRRVMTLPLYADLDLEIVRKICSLILECKK